MPAKWISFQDAGRSCLPIQGNFGAHEISPWTCFPICYFSCMSERISVDPDICNGKPVVRGTRITVQTILGFLAAGDSIEDVLEEYPNLRRDDILACLDYAASLVA